MNTFLLNIFFEIILRIIMIIKKQVLLQLLITKNMLNWLFCCIVFNYKWLIFYFIAIVNLFLLKKYLEVFIKGQI